MASAATTEMRAAVTLEELTQTTEFRHLSPKMAMWVSSYVQHFIDHGTFDPIFATQAAYECKTDESARTFGYHLLANPKIIFTLNRFFGVSQEQSFLKALEKAMYNSRLTTAQVKVLNLYYQAQGWSTAGIPKFNGYTTVAERNANKFKIGDIVEQDGENYRVTKVNADGKVLEAIEVE